MKLSSTLISYPQIAPLAMVLLLFLGVPLAVVVVVSFWNFDIAGLYPAFTFSNYIELFESSATYALYTKTVQYAAAVWVFTVFFGFTVSYFLVFHVKTVFWKLILFLLCTVPFWTSNIIRMIAWIPFLGRNGVFNKFLLAFGLIDAPLEFLLFSDFAVVLTYVHIYTLFMIVPIFNSMARISPSLLEAATDAGANRFQVLTNVVIPLSKNGIALGTIFVLTLVMGDFYIVRIMSGGQSASVASAMSNEIALLQYPPAAASAVVLIVIVVLMISTILRFVDVQKSLTE